MSINFQARRPLSRGTQVEFASTCFCHVLNDQHIDRTSHGRPTTTDAKAVTKDAGKTVCLNIDGTIAGDAGAPFKAICLSAQPSPNGTAVIAYGHAGAGANRAASGGIRTGGKTVDCIGGNIQTTDAEITATIDQGLSTAF